MPLKALLNDVMLRKPWTSKVVLLNLGEGGRSGVNGSQVGVSVSVELLGTVQHLRLSSSVSSVGYQPGTAPVTSKATVFVLGTVAGYSREATALKGATLSVKMTCRRV